MIFFSQSLQTTVVHIPFHVAKMGERKILKPIKTFLFLKKSLEATFEDLKTCVQSSDVQVNLFLKETLTHSIYIDMNF